MLHRSAVKDYDARVICYYRLLYIDFASLSSGIYYFDSQVCLIEIREMWLLCPGIMKPALFHSESLTFDHQESACEPISKCQNQTAG